MATLILPYTGAEIEVVDKEQVERFKAAGWKVKPASKPAAKASE